nr:unnamed protein product [Callosobruchus analis]
MHFHYVISSSLTMNRQLDHVHFQVVVQDLLARNCLNTFILQFVLKCNSSCKNGSQSLLELTKRSRYLSLNLENITDSVVQRNGYFAHPENILLTMLCDNRKHNY